MTSKVKFLLNQFADGTSKALKDRALFRKYAIAWWRALRPISLVIAVVSCGVGIALAYADDRGHAVRAALVLVAGIALQSGVNLINDFFEFKQQNIADKIPDLAIFGSKRAFIEWIIFATGLGFFAVTVPIGIFLVVETGLPLLLLGIVGFVGGYFYTGEPFNYKRRGLGVLFVFFLMGVFMISGSYYAVAGVFAWQSILIGLPVSALVSFILLCNEIRDYEYDKEHGLQTLTQRIGLRPAIVIGFVLIAGAYLGPLVLARYGLFPHLYFIYVGLPFLVLPVKSMFVPPSGRKIIIPSVMVHHFVYGTAFVCTFMFPDVPV